MSAATAIGLVGESLREVLLEELQTLTPPVGVTLLAPTESGTDPRVNLYLYRVEENPQLKNLDFRVKRGAASTLEPPPLSLNLSYMLTPFATNDQQLGQVTAHEILGEAMRVLHENAVIPTRLLANGLADAREELRVMLKAAEQKELVDIWATFSQPFRLSVVYEISVAQIDMGTSRERAMAPRVRTIGAPRVQAPYQAPLLSGITPRSGAPGTRVTVQGASLAGWKAYVTWMRSRLLDAADITGDTFEFTIPAESAPGFAEVRIDISHLTHATFLFEVVP